MSKKSLNWRCYFVGVFSPDVDISPDCWYFFPMLLLLFILPMLFRLVTLYQYFLSDATTFSEFFPHPCVSVLNSFGGCGAWYAYAVTNTYGRETHRKKCNENGIRNKTVENWNKQKTWKYRKAWKRLEIERTKVSRKVSPNQKTKLEWVDFAQMRK